MQEAGMQCETDRGDDYLILEPGRPEGIRNLTTVSVPMVRVSARKAA